MALNVTQVKNAGPGRHADGNGLYLLVKPTLSRSWLLRVQVDGKRRDIGLGGFTDRTVTDGPKPPLLQRKLLTLAEAREKSHVLRLLAKAGKNVVAERDRDLRSPPTFAEALKECHAELSSGWTDRHAAAFLSTLTEHAIPKLGTIRVDHIEAPAIRDMLAPIWTEKPVMARKVRHRVATVLNFAKAKGWRLTDAPGKAVTVGLSKQKEGGNFAAMPFADVPAFVATLRDKPLTAGRAALLFTILTGARSGEVRSAMWSHIDLDAKLWNRPAELMKSRRAHSVTLNDPAVEILQLLDCDRLLKLDGLVFPGKGGKQLSDMTLLKAVRDAGSGQTVHGFRSSFTDWAAETAPSIPKDVVEAALAHLVPDRVERAYRRTTFLDMRRKLLDLWGRHVDNVQAVIPMKAVS